MASVNQPSMRNSCVGCNSWFQPGLQTMLCHWTNRSANEVMIVALLSRNGTLATRDGLQIRQELFRVTEPGTIFEGTSIFSDTRLISVRPVDASVGSKYVRRSYRYTAVLSLLLRAASAASSNLSEVLTLRAAMGLSHSRAINAATTSQMIMAQKTLLQEPVLE
jgi:hypothetical protein